MNIVFSIIGWVAWTFFCLLGVDLRLWLSKDGSQWATFSMGYGCANILLVGHRSCFSFHPPK